MPCQLAPNEAADGAAPGGGAWEAFFRAHPSARFFRERRYLALSFPSLGPPARLEHIVELGAGCGSSILPLLKLHPGWAG